MGFRITRPLLAALSLAVFLGGCGFVRESRLNPLNWFGRSQPTENIVLVEKAASASLVADVLSMEVEPYQGGAIIRATGRTQTQGWWQAELVQIETDDPSALVYEFRILPPLVRTDVNTPRSREVTVALALSNIKLDGISTISVQGAQNGRTTGR